MSQKSLKPGFWPGLWSLTRVWAAHRHFRQVTDFLLTTCWRYVCNRTDLMEFGLYQTFISSNSGLTWTIYAFYMTAAHWLVQFFNETHILRWVWDRWSTNKSHHLGKHDWLLHTTNLLISYLQTAMQHQLVPQAISSYTLIYYAISHYSISLRSVLAVDWQSCNK